MLTSCVAAAATLVVLAVAAPAKFDVAVTASPGGREHTLAALRHGLTTFLAIPEAALMTHYVPPTAAAAYAGTEWFEFMLDVADTKRREALEYQLLNATVAVQVGMNMVSFSNNVEWNTLEIPATVQWRLENVTTGPGVTEGTVAMRPNDAAPWGYICSHGIGAFVARAICGSIFGLNATMPADSAVPLMDRCVPGPMSGVHTFCEEGAVTAKGPACRLTTQWLPNHPPPHVHAHALGGLATAAPCPDSSYPCGLGVRCKH